MTGSAIRWQIQRHMARIGRGVVVRLVAGFTIRGCALVTSRMTFDTVNGDVRAGQREIGLIVIKRVLRIARRVARKAC